MAKEICISTTPHETRLAILEDDQLAEIYYERENEYTLAGSIYKGRVTRVLPGMQSSFVDVGLERDAFLYVTDFLEEQEDSEEYASEGNGKSREPRPTREPAEEPQARTATDRNGGDRHQERSPEKNQDRGGRRPEAAASAQPETARGPVREGGRAGRERAREQAVAPLREAVPAAQDIEEKGDDESPEGTRRWRGRRGRRRGVRGGLPSTAPQATARPLPSETPLALNEASEAEEAAAPSFVAEHEAPEGLELSHTLHASREEESAPRVGSSRDRSPRRSREPYAQHSTLDRPTPQPERSERESAPPARSTETALAPAGAIVLPGESLSKYGSAPADPATPTPAATATVPRTVRPVNYVAPKPSTLVELPADWDGGAVMPGETISRYRGPAASAVSTPVVQQSAPAEPQVVTADEIPVGEANLSLPGEPDGAAVEAVQEESAPLALAASEEITAHEIEPLAEPEIMAAAVAPSAEATPSQVAEPELVAALKPEVNQAAETQDESVSGPPADYEPENASASYRVQRTGPSELRLSSPVADESQTSETPEPEPAAATPSSAETLAEPVGHFADAEPLVPSTFGQKPSTGLHADVPEFVGELPSDPATSPEEDAPSDEHSHSAAHPHDVPEPWHPTPALQILHDDGSIDLAAAQESPASSGSAYAVFDEPHLQLDEAAAFDETTSEPVSSFAAEPEQAESPTHQIQEATHSFEFSDLVDRMQGFAPGSGLLEEETIDEEEYDFEPLHAHAEDGDQEDLEEETLDQAAEALTLDDAVRESHLEQRVQHAHQASEAESSLVAEETVAFGYEEVEEGEEDFEESEEGEEPAQSAQPGEPQRNGRSDEGRGRGRGRSSGGRNGGRRNGPGRGRSAQSQELPIISELLKQGQEILVQIAKEPIAKKGARITSHIALPGRFLVFMPTVSHVGVSRKIASDEERQRLKRILISEKGESSGGFIVRTAAEGASEEDLRADLRFLISLWTEIKQRSDTAKAPALIYHDLNLIERILRDQVSSNFSTIWVDSEAEYERIIRFLSRFQPQLVRRVKLYTKETPLFEHFGIQEEISKALKSKVWLKSGGSIVINQTEALVAIDINTGKYVGKTSRLEDTIVKTNLDAIPEIVRQIRLRDLGGIIVIDFIDMDERKNRNRVLAALEEELKNDRAPSKVLQFNDFGLVAITRKRVKQSLERTLSVTCETCTGTGMVKSPITVCNEIYTEMRKMLKHLDGKDVMLRVHPEVVKQLKAGNGKWINELEELVTKTIIIKSDPALHPEQFDIH